ncbi:MAG TPA: type II secretion system protein [Desulfatiglandales bacterium]|nr:type II secretion system protein [Desulfatiglandales bacterium]
MSARSKTGGESGFTLIEIIAVILITAVLGALLFQYFGQSFIKSSAPIERLQKALQLQQVVENITEDYERSAKTSAFLEGTLKNSVGMEGTDQDNAYGQYHVAQNRFIKFTAGSEVAAAGADTKDTLKVRLSNELDETITVLFTVQ